MYAIVAASYVWGGQWSQKRILFYCDKQTVVSIINAKRSRSPRRTDLVQALTLQTLKYNFYFKAVHVPGHQKDVADSLSRFQLTGFWRLALHADQYPQSLPETLSLLVADLHHYQVALLAQSTRRTYSNGVKQFLNFCFQFHLHKTSPILPHSETVLIYLAVFLAKTLNPDTIKVYLAVVRHFHLINGFDLPESKFSRLQYVLRGIKRVKGVTAGTHLPITLTHLSIFYRLLHSRAVPLHDELMLWATVSLAFFGFLRIGEMTRSIPFNPSTHLTKSDITFHLIGACQSQYMQVKIKASKKDPFRLTVTITIGGNGSMYCPVKAIKGYLSKCTNPSGPLFCYSNSTSLSRSHFAKELRRLLAQGGFNYSNFSGHSFRNRAATTAASRSLPHWLIQTLGRWFSGCYLRYICTPVSVLTNVSKQLITE